MNISWPGYFLRLRIPVLTIPFLTISVLVMPVLIVSILIISILIIPVQLFAATPKYQSANENFNVKLQGNFQYDYNRYDDVFNADDDGNRESRWFMRRSRLALSGDFSKDWEYKVQWNLGIDSRRNSSKGGTPESVYLRYQGFDNLSITAGQHKEPFGFENATSSKAVTAIERSAPSQLFAPGKNIGVTVKKQFEHFIWAANYTDEGNNGDDQLSRAYSTRVTYAALNHDRQALHFGFAYTNRKEKENKAKVRPELRDVDSKARIRSGKFAADGFIAYGVEFAWAHQRYHSQAEYFSGEFEGANGSEDYSADGWYAQAGTFLTNDTRHYKFSKGNFSSVKPTSDWGAVEVFARYSETDLEDHTKGNSGKIATLGLNWYLNKNWRTAINVINANYKHDVKGESNGTAIAARLQFVF
jgi:phosphate-selective porin OprO and OprP